MNVLFVMTDQHIAGCTGYENHPHALTPNMDRLAASGVRFRHCYTANPICTPTRVSILSGQYCHNHGYFGLDGPTPARLPSFLGHFKQHGYRTAAVGKLHLPNQPREWAREDCDLYLDIMNVNNDGLTYLSYLKQHGHEGDFDASWLIDAPTRDNNPRDARPSNMPFEHSVEGYATRHAIDFIDDAADRGQPFCMEVSYHRPHQVYTPDKRFWDMYPDDLPLPPFALDDAPDRPPHFRRMAEGGRRMEPLYEPKTMEERYRRVWRGYLACITHCDHGLGLLMDHLEARGLADNTVVVYSADHGAYSGLFGVPEKAPGICSEQVCRIPSVWRVPGLTPPDRESRRLAHIVDLAPTLVSLCGLPGMDWVDGCDLTPLLRGGDAPLRDVAVTEHPWSKSVRWDHWRLVHYQRAMFPGQDTGELYDLDADSWEQRNLYHDAEHQPTVQEGRRRLLEWLIATTRHVTSLPVLRDDDGRPLPQAADGKQSNAYSEDARLSQNLNYL